MKRLFIFVLIACCGAAASLAETPPPLSSVQAVFALDKASAERAIPVDFEATLTYFRPYEQTMFVQDGDQAVFVLATTDTHLVEGDRIRVRGTTRAGLRPYVESHDISLVGHGALPPPHPAKFKELISTADDCKRIIVQGRVRSAVDEIETDVRGGSRPRQNTVHMKVLTDGGIIDVLVDHTDGRSIDQFIDADVAITGIAGAKMDGKMQETGVMVHVTSISDVRVLHLSAADPWSLPATPMDQIMRSYEVRDLTARVRVRGTVTFYQPGTAVVLQDGPRSLWVTTISRIRLDVGEVVDAIGFPDTHSGFLTLHNSVIRQLNLRAPITPQPVGWSDLAASHKVFDLVTIEGKVVTENRETGQDEYVISTQGHLFTAIFRHNVLFRYPDEPLPALLVISPGSMVRITGVCVTDDANAFLREVPFNILLRSPADIAIISDPPWLGERHLIEIIGWLLLAVFAIGIRAFLVERSVRRHNASLAYIEKRRAKILEDISNSRPLAEILEAVTELVSARLGGAVCWCEIIDGAKLGNPPARGMNGLRIVQQSIAGRSGAPLGNLFAAFAAHAKPNVIEKETLVMAGALAMLAIETSRLHSDMVYRSEFDLLTDVQNRFSLEKFLDAEIASASQSAGIFGLLYIDLDRFKQVNDDYGHHVGDRYLQEAAMRMKHQLRPNDLLARIGGDEFAVVIPHPGSRTHLQEIATRLERCFDEPFRCDELVLLGTASVGLALYPEDGKTSDNLLKAADAAMYAVKTQHHEFIAGPTTTP